jgi:hypothetical protein
VHQYYLQLKMLFNRENGRHMDTNNAKEVLAVRHSSSHILPPEGC